MNTGEIISSIISGVAVLLLGFIAKALGNVRHDFRRFMQEHSWLMATTLWTRDKVIIIMDTMDMPVDGVPPNDLPNGKRK